MWLSHRPHRNQRLRQPPSTNGDYGGPWGPGWPGVPKDQLQSLPPAPGKPTRAAWSPCTLQSGFLGPPRSCPTTTLTGTCSPAPRKRHPLSCHPGPQGPPRLAVLSSTHQCAYLSIHVQGTLCFPDRPTRLLPLSGPSTPGHLCCHNRRAWGCRFRAAGGVHGCL